MTETTTVTTETAVDIHKSRAITYVGGHAVADVIDELATYYRRFDAARNSNEILRTRIQELVDTVTEFIKDNINAGASTSDLKQLARELDIELTKTVQVEMTVKYYAEVTVPLDYDNDSLNESDFDIEIRYTSNQDDVDIDNESTEVDEFEVTEN